MRFQVPQFIEVEDKIFGPLTFKQFIYVAGGAGFAFMLYAVQGIFIAGLIGMPILALGLALAFYKINNRPFIEVLQSAVTFYVKSKLYLWKKGPATKKAIEASVEAPTNKLYVPKLSQNKLKEIAWSLDIKESLYENTDQVK